MDADVLSPSPAGQLEAVAGLGSILGGRGIDYWLFGGWAVDFWAGAVTRAHDDVDVAAWLADREVIHDALVAAGWVPAAVDDEAAAAGYEWQGWLVEVTFVVADDQGRVLIPFAGGPAEWSTTPFGDQRRTLHGVTAPTVPLDLLVKDKSTPRGDAADAAKDAADLQALCRMFRSLSLPPKRAEV